MLETTDACLVYFTTLEYEDDIVLKEFKHFNKLVRKIEGSVKVLVFRLDDKSEEY